VIDRVVASFYDVCGLCPREFRYDTFSEKEQQDAMQPKGDGIQVTSLLKISSSADCSLCLLAVVLAAF
jgi:hypothetical protein